MKLLISALFALSLIGTVSAQNAHPAPVAKAPIYDIKSDGKVQIEKALLEAKASKKNVLVQFGANWCGWCYKLHDLFAADKQISTVLKKNYVVVLIDVDKDHNKETNAKYGNPIQFGLPAIIVLDPNGKLIKTQDSGKLEDGPKHSPEKVLDFLKSWVPKS